MASKYLASIFFFSLVVILPIQVHYTGDYGVGGKQQSNDTDAENTMWLQMYTHSPFSQVDYVEEGKKPRAGIKEPPSGYWWMYVGFVYLFTAMALYLIIVETKRVIRIRQNYLGSQSTITDRTIRLSGIPPESRSEEKIREIIEGLEIGKVETVTLCKNWRKLDDLVEERLNLLRKLEESWTVYLGHKNGSGNRKYVNSQQSHQTNSLNGEDEESRLLESGNGEQSHGSSYAQDRPKTRIWYGFLGLQSQKVDAIDYYEEKLRKLDERIKAAREKDYEATPLAFVTLDSPASCVSIMSSHYMTIANHL